jgi:predicted dehydrogenase
MQQLRIGIMGCADIARRLVIPAIQTHQSLFSIVGIASRTFEKAKEFGDLFNITPYEGYETLLEPSLGVDIIYMPLPTGLHDEWITKCLQAGKHVYVEKSLALNAESAERLVSIARSKRLLLLENFMFRYHSQHQYVFNKIAKGELGEIRLFRSSFGFPPLKENNFRYDPQMGGGALLDAGAYTVSAARWFLGEDLKVATANLHINQHWQSDIYGDMTLVNSKGVTAQLSFGFDNFYQCNYEIWGSKAKIVAERSFTPKPNEQPTILFQHNTAGEVYHAAADNHFANILAEVYRSATARDFESHWNGVLNQSYLLTQIMNKSNKFYIA